MEIQSQCEQRAKSQGWRAITPAEWEEKFGTCLKGKGTFFAKETNGFASNKTGDAAWEDLCVIACIK